MGKEVTSESLVQKLFLQHASPLRGFILGRLPDRVAADDVFQEVFIVAQRRAPDYDPRQNFLAWARGIAKLKVLEHYRSRGSQPQLFDEELLALMVADVDRQQDVWERRRTALAGCIAQLAPRARQILELRYAEQPLSADAIAARLAWTAGAVNVALSRARKFLQDCTRQALVAGDMP